jgi:hypothetical protein
MEYNLSMKGERKKSFESTKSTQCFVGIRRDSEAGGRNVDVK